MQETRPTRRDSHQGAQITAQNEHKAERKTRNNNAVRLNLTRDYKLLLLL